MTTITFAGATGWAGSALARAIAQQPDMQLAAAVSRTHAGKTLGDVLSVPDLPCPLFATATEALAEPCDVFIEYTKLDVAKPNILAALARGAHVVVGTSGLTDADYEEIDIAATKAGLGVLACGNFALTFALLQKFAVMAARVIPQWEILDYAPDAKRDAPSGTARELAYRLSRVRESQLTVPLGDVQGAAEARGARIAGSQIHSLRLPGNAYEVEIRFGMPGQKFSMYHQAGTSAEAYVDGALLAIRKVSTLVGLRRGLDTVLDL